jgi:hypothetical protein
MHRGPNRRRATRVRLVALATLEAIGKLHSCNQAVGTVRDVSRYGIGLETGQPPIKGQTVILRLLLDDTIHELRTRATRVSRRGDSNYYQVGLDWSGCPPEQLAFLDRVLDALTEQPLT